MGLFQNGIKIVEQHTNNKTNNVNKVFKWIRCYKRKA